jgi:hypothetical protein
LDYFASQASLALARVFSATLSLWLEVGAQALTRVFTATACSLFEFVIFFLLVV